MSTNDNEIPIEHKPPTFEIQVMAELANWYRQTCADPAVDSLLADARKILAKHGVELGP